MPKFKTAYERGNTTYAEQGSNYVKEYEYRIDKKSGRKVLVENGETNIYEMIQASAESCKLENIIKRATMGDTSGLEARTAQYIDLTEMPTNLMEMQNYIIKATQEFEKLPIEIKNKFDNSAEKYISEIGTQKWLDNMGISEEPIKEELKIETIKEGESVNE